MKVLICAVLSLWLLGCSVLLARPDYQSQRDRMELLKTHMAPIEKKVMIYWQENSVPFVEAATNQDLAFSIGVVHAHLRLGQMEILRYISQGRLSEIGGPVPSLEKIDRLLRVINFTQAGEASLKKLSPESWQWLHHFTRGINWYIDHRLKTPPVEFEVIGKTPSHFSELEILTLGKLIGADLTWAIYLKFLKLKEQPGWESLLQDGQEDLLLAEPSAETVGDVERVTQLIKAFSKSGSNSVVISGAKTQSGSAMIASDPHVGLFLPNFWLLMGIKSDNVHAIGYMIPGVPFIGVGRNPSVAWGGTNMRGISSHLYRIPQQSRSQLVVKKETLRRRWWSDKVIEIYQSPYGPIFNEIDDQESGAEEDALALYWLGREGSDELDTFLKVQRSQNWQEFRQAFESYRISAMNILYADSAGNIGMMPAYGQPVLKDPSKTLDLLKETDNPVVGVLKPTDQSNPSNPDSGFIASANNKPFSHTAVPYSYGFSSNDRILRMKTLIRNLTQVSVHDLMNLQNDVYDARAHEFARLFEGVPELNLTTESKRLKSVLTSWNGEFSEGSEGAVAQELVRVYAWDDYIAQLDLPDLQRQYRRDNNDKLKYLTPWLKSIDTQNLAKLSKAWFEKAARQQQKTPTWGHLQRQSQQSPLGLLPLVGSRFSLDDYGANGGDNTLNKSGRIFSDEPQSVTYGASARHISDLSQPDENYFVMHGGNDGWLMNDQLADQVSSWRSGKYIRLPLTMERVRAAFTTHTSELIPQK